LKSTPITLRRVDMDQDMIQVNRKLGKFERPMVDVANSFEYNTFFDEKIEAKKRDNSYRVFKRVQRKSGLFPKAQEKNNLDDDIDSRTITVWCSNDYLGLGQHPKLKKAVM
jgi:5-aminolevulinate synthase